MERTIRRRRTMPALGWGNPKALRTGERSVFAHRVDWEGTTVLLVHSFSSEPQSVRIEIGPTDDESHVVDVLDEGRSITEVDEGCLELKLEAYGYRWFSLEDGGAPRARPK
jgi:maltose alpha-D-glucosyltransferase/alpha-amylase